MSGDGKRDIIGAGENDCAGNNGGYLKYALSHTLLYCPTTKVMIECQN